MSTQGKTFQLCLLSAIICGLITAIDCGNLDGDDKCHILVFQSFSSWLHWVNWLPGAVFGFVFAYTHYRNKYLIRTFSLLSGIFYLVAGLIGSYMHSVLVLGIVVGGVFGAFALSITVEILARRNIREEDIFRTLVTSIVASGVLGIIINAIDYLARLAGDLSGGGDSGPWDGSFIFSVQSVLFYSSAFAIWQIPVGLSLNKSLREHTIAQGDETSDSA